MSARKYIIWAFQSAKVAYHNTCVAAGGRAARTIPASEYPEPLAYPPRPGSAAQAFRQAADVSNIEILPFRRRYLDKAADTYVTVFNGPEWKDNWNHRSARTHLEEVLDTPNSVGFVAINRADGSVVGLTLGTLRTWENKKQLYIYELAVHPDARGNKLGNQLLQNIEDAAAKEGATEIVLDTKRGIPAEHLFKQEGFEETPDRIFMEKTIQSRPFSVAGLQ